MPKDNWKELLLGRVSRRVRTGNHSLPTDGRLRAPLPYGTKMRCFCTGCGALLDLERETAEKLIGSQPSLQGKVITVNSCTCCSKDFSNPKLQSI